MTHPSFTPPTLENMNRLLPAFDFTALLASNDESAVFAATQKSLDRNVAIKLLAPQVSADSGFRRSFESTARTMAKLNHPNLIGVFDSGCVDGMLYFVMEFIPGKSLQRSAQGRCVELSQSLRLIEGISNGLAHAHDHGVAHGCVEPSIILLNQKAEPKIGGFGVGHQSGDPGNPYLAPELRIPGAVPDFRADVHAVGAIFYELITGHPHRHGAPAPSVLTQCPPRIDAIWRKATNPEPSSRHLGMREFQRDVSALISPPRGGRGGAAVGAGKTVAVASPKLIPAGKVPPPAEAQSPVSAHVGVNWHLIRNLFIIAGLSYAIHLAWGLYQKKNQRIDRENREAQARMDADKARAAEEAKLRALTRKVEPGANKVPTSPEEPPVGIPKSETAEESLARLKLSLAAGRRGEMPVGAVDQGESWYFLVREPLSWPEAAEFAEQHGAHLAIPAAGADLTWLVNNVTRKLDVWIGAARSGQGAWALADGKPWKPTKDPSGTGSYVGVDKAGFLRAATVKVRLPFVIQWHRDGKNPGALASMLAATKASLASSSPVYPPGTRSFEGRNFLHVARPVDWNEAVRIATSGGACLAVAATSAEIGFLDEMTADIIAPDGIWLGGMLKETQWTWVTNEPWKTAKWMNGAVNDLPDSGLIIRPGKNWDAVRTSARASGLILEWSADAKGKSGTSAVLAPAGNAVAPTDIAPLLLKAKELIAEADRKRSEQLGANSRKLVSDLESHVRGMPRSGQETWRPEADRVKACIKDFRVPVMIPQSSGIRITTVMDEVIRYGAKKQQQIDDEFLAAAAKLHGAFLSKLNQSLAQARQTGQALMVRSLEDSIKQAENPDSWVRSLGVEPKPQNPVPTAKGGGNGGPGGNLARPGGGKELIDDGLSN
jgi:serine/threonine protein kinase